MAENDKIDWVGCQWMMQGYCGRRTAPQPAGDEPPEPAVEQPVVPGADATVPVEPIASGEKASRRNAARRGAWSAARNDAAAKRRRRPAA